jgi:hypothetical protein
MRFANCPVDSAAGVSFLVIKFSPDGMNGEDILCRCELESKISATKDGLIAIEFFSEKTGKFLEETFDWVFSISASKICWC